MSNIQSINPYTLEINGTFNTLSQDEILQKIKIAHNTYQTRSKTDKRVRKNLFLKMADLIDEKKEYLASIETKEMGMLYSYSLSWLTKSANLIRRFANNAEKILADEIYESNGLQVQSQYDPIGVLFGIAPWNFPFNQVLRACVPNILAGNTVIYKHASNTPIAGIEIEKLFLEYGFPIWVYQNIIVSSKDSEFIISQPEIAGVNLTWSEWAGRNIWSLAGKYLKPSVLELWWNDAFIVADTDNLQKVAESAVNARISNNWQKCNSSKRFIVRAKDYDNFCKYFVQYTQKLIIWDPMNINTQIWPMAKAELVDEIDNQVQKTIKEWAKLLIWWYKINRTWYFYAPTVLADVDSNMTSYKEEVFWPVASIIKVQDLEEAINVANNSDFGLCGCVYGDDLDQCKNIASKIQTGMIFINKPSASQASLPFGGVKKSGYGKENGPEWLRAFTNKKIIVW